MRDYHYNLDTKDRFQVHLTDDEKRTEEWKPCRHYPGWEASQFGRIRYSKTKTVWTPQINPAGYGFINGQFAVHRLVMSAWSPSFDAAKTAGLEVDHVDGHKWNNRLTNLQYLRHKENTAKSCGRQVVVGTTCFPSVAQAAEALGKSRQQVRRYIEKQATTDGTTVLDWSGFRTNDGQVATLASVEAMN